MDAEKLGRANSAAISQLAARVLNKPNRNTIVIAGDSITWQNHGSTHMDPEASIYTQNSGYFSWGNTFLNHMFTCVKNAGVSAESAGDLLARLDTDVLAYNADYVFVHIGTNDSEADGSAVTLTALQKIFDRIRATNSTLIVSTLCPRDNLVAGTTMKIYTEINKFIRKYTNEHFVILVDFWRVLVDISTGIQKAGTLYDGIHPNAYGAFLMGQEFANAISAKVSFTPNLPCSNYEHDGIMSNPMMVGGTTIVTGWTKVGSGTGTTSIEAASDGNGSWQVLTETSDAASNIVYASNTAGIGTTWNIGDTIYGVAEVDTTAATEILYCRLLVRCYIAGWGSILRYSTDMTVDTIKGNCALPAGGYKKVMKTMPIVIPATTAILYVGIEFLGTGAVKFRRCNLINDSV